MDNINKKKGVLIFQDSHIKKSSNKRKDNIFDSLSHKISQIAQIANDNDLITIFCGDLVDNHNWKLEDCKLIENMFRTFKSPVYCVYGNHDLMGSNIQENCYSPLSVLNSNPLSPIITVTEEFFVDDFYFIPVNWKQYNSTLSNAGNIKNLKKAKKENKTIILFGHVSVSENFTPSNICFNDLDINPLIDFATFGDIHTPTNKVLHKNKHTICCNAGALQRCNTAEANNHPAVLHLTETKELIRIKLDVLPPEEVFFLEEKEAKQKVIVDLNQAMAAVKETKIRNPEILLNTVATEIGASKESLVLALSYIK
jgi:DNA repair exonuclease SbcCD nuclease subunit